MNHRQRIRLLKLAQTTVPASGGTTTTTTIPDDPNADPTVSATPETLNSSQASVNVRSLPSFKAQLFSLRPDLIDDINRVANTANKYLLLLSQNKASFSTVYTNPAITGDQYSQSVKNLLSLSKWLYSFITASDPQYSVGVLQQSANKLSTMINSFSFSEPNATNAKTELTALAQAIITKLGTANATQ